MERPQIMEQGSLRPMLAYYEGHRTLFNLAIEGPEIQLGIAQRNGAHDEIQFPPSGGKTFRGIVWSQPVIGQLELALWPGDERLFADNSLSHPKRPLLETYVKIARSLIENGLPKRTVLNSMLSSLLQNMGAGMFTQPLFTLSDLARQALPQDAKPDNVIPFPAPLSFAYSENHPDKKCSFGFNIVHPEKFPYNARMAASAIWTFLESHGWDPQSLDIVLEPLNLPLKDGERVIHILNRIVNQDRTEMSFCIRKPLEYEGSAPIRGQIVFRK